MNTKTQSSMSITNGAARNATVQAGEISQGPVVGEVRADLGREDIPLSDSAAAAVEVLTEGDDNPCWVTVEILEGPGNHGNYKRGAIRDIVSGVNESEPMGHLGHRKPKDLPFEFPDPTTHWFAAEMVNKQDTDGNPRAAAVIYGLIDKAFPDLRRWVKARRIKEVSIYGKPRYEAGTRNVVGYDLISIDWTPRERSGMETNLLWTSEMSWTSEVRGDYVDPTDVVDDLVAGEYDGSLDEAMNLVVRGVQEKWAETPNYVRPYRIFPEYVIVKYDNYRENAQGLWKVPYELVEEDGEKDRVEFGDAVEVVEHRTYEEVTGDDGDADMGAEIDAQHTSEVSELQNQTVEEKLADVRAAVAKGECSLCDIVKELGITGEMVLNALKDDERISTLKNAAEIGKKLSKKLDITEEMELDEALDLAGEMADLYYSTNDEGEGEVNTDEAEGDGEEVDGEQEEVEEEVEVRGEVGEEDVEGVDGEGDGSEEEGAKGEQEDNSDTDGGSSGEGEDPEEGSDASGEQEESQEDEGETGETEKGAEVEGEQDATGEVDVSDLIARRVNGEQAQKLVERVLQVEDGAPEDVVVGEIENLLEDDEIRSMISKLHTDGPVIKGDKGTKSGKFRSGRVRTVRI